MARATLRITLVWVLVAAATAQQNCQVPTNTSEPSGLSISADLSLLRCPPMDQSPAASAALLKAALATCTGWPPDWIVQTVTLGCKDELVRVKYAFLVVSGSYINDIDCVMRRLLAPRLAKCGGDGWPGPVADLRLQSRGVVDGNCYIGLDGTAQCKLGTPLFTAVAISISILMGIGLIATFAACNSWVNMRRNQAARRSQAQRPPPAGQSWVGGPKEVLEIGGIPVLQPDDQIVAGIPLHQDGKPYIWREDGKFFNKEQAELESAIPPADDDTAPVADAPPSLAQRLRAYLTINSHPSPSRAGTPHAAPSPQSALPSDHGVGGSPPGLQPTPQDHLRPEALPSRGSSLLSGPSSSTSQQHVTISTTSRPQSTAGSPAALLGAGPSAPGTPHSQGSSHRELAAPAAAGSDVIGPRVRGTPAWTPTGTAAGAVEMTAAGPPDAGLPAWSPGGAAAPPAVAAAAPAAQRPGTWNARSWQQLLTHPPWGSRRSATASTLVTVTVQPNAGARSLPHPFRSLGAAAQQRPSTTDTSTLAEQQPATGAGMASASQLQGAVSSLEQPMAQGRSSARGLFLQPGQVGGPLDAPQQPQALVQPAADRVVDFERAPSPPESMVAIMDLPGPMQQHSGSARSLRSSLSARAERRPNSAGSI